MDVLIKEELYDLYEQMRLYYTNMNHFIQSALVEWLLRSTSAQKMKEYDNVMLYNGLYPTKEMWVIIFTILKERNEFSPIHGDDIVQKFNEIVTEHLNGKMTEPELRNIVKDFNQESQNLKDWFKKSIQESYLDLIKNRLSMVKDLVF